MRQVLKDGSLVVPFQGLPFPSDFEVCWAGECSLGFPPISAFCFGSLNGELLFSAQDLSPLAEWEPRKASASAEAINGVAELDTWVAVSTRQEINFWPMLGPGGGCVPVGAHGISATAGGYFVAALGRNGILAACPPFEEKAAPTAYIPDENLYVYRVVSFRSQAGEEVVGCAARLGGIVAGRFSMADEAQAMRSVRLPNIDVVDICPLRPDSYSLAAAALGRNGTLVLFRDVLTDKAPRTFSFKNIKGVGYRVVCRRGDIYILTSKGLYILGSLGSRFLDGELREGITTPIMPLVMAPVDMNPAWTRWLLVVLANEVRRFDLDVIHDFVPQHIGHGEIQETQPLTLPLEPEFRDITPTARQLSLAG